MHKDRAIEIAESLGHKGTKGKVNLRSLGHRIKQTKKYFNYREEGTIERTFALIIMENSKI